MPREAKPYVERGWYISRPQGVYLRLCPVADGMTEAKRLLRLKLAEMDADQQRNGGRPLAKLSVAELFALFLEIVEAEKAPDTFLDYRRWLTEFARVYGSRLARSITKADASDFKLRMMNTTYVRGNQPPRKYKPKTVNNALIALRRAFNWAVETERLPAGTNPFANVDMLPYESRQRVATEEEYQSLLKHCSDDAFRHVLTAMRYTSARPQDIYSLEWPMVVWGDHMWVIPKHKASRTQKTPRPRVIGMSAPVEALLQDRLAAFGPTGRVFLNSEGQPWTKNALGLRMRRLRTKAGITPDENGEHFVLYTNRHTFLTHAGADPTVSHATLMAIAGHSDPRTTARYVHAANVAVAAAGRRVGQGLVSDAGRADTDGPCPS